MEQTKPWVTQFGIDDDSWNLDDENSSSYGEPGINVITRSIFKYLSNNYGVEIKNRDAHIAALFALPEWMVSKALRNKPKNRLTYLNDLHGALTTWVALRNAKTTVADAALVFNVKPKIVISEINDGYFTYIGGKVKSGDPTLMTIELEGE